MRAIKARLVHPAAPAASVPLAHRGRSVFLARLVRTVTRGTPARPDRKANKDSPGQLDCKAPRDPLAMMVTTVQSDRPD